VLDHAGATKELVTQVQFVDPSVSREKFEKELLAYRAIEREQQKLGWWMLEATFPTVFVVFVAPQLKPPAVVCGVLLDFTNYDFEPPSVRLVDPFTRIPYKAKELPTVLLRKQQSAISAFPGAPQIVNASPLMQAHDPEEVPFLCVPGVREYHEHPAHTGDSWFAHRGLGVGTLFQLLSLIYQYGVKPLSGFTLALQVTGLQQSEPPL